MERISDDPFVSHLDPNKIAQPSMTPEKMRNMWGNPWRNCRSHGTTGRVHLVPTNPLSNRSAKKGSRDTFLVGVASEQYPELEQVCNKLLPGNVQREDNGTGSGTGGVAGAETPAERRAAAKREGRAHFQQTRQGKTGKRDARVQAIKTATQEAVSAAVSGVAQELKETWQPQQQESKWRQQTDKADSKVAKIELAQSTVNAHIKFDHMLKEEEATGGEEDEHSRKRKRFLKKQLIFLEAQMETDSEDE